MNLRTILARLAVVNEIFETRPDPTLSPEVLLAESVNEARLYLLCDEIRARVAPVETAAERAEAPALWDLLRAPSVVLVETHPDIPTTPIVDEFAEILAALDAGQSLDDLVPLAA